MGHELHEIGREIVGQHEYDVRPLFAVLRDCPRTLGCIVRSLRARRYCRGRLAGRNIGRGSVGLSGTGNGRRLPRVAMRNWVCRNHSRGRRKPTRRARNHADRDRNRWDRNDLGQISTASDASIAGTPASAKIRFHCPARLDDARTNKRQRQCGASRRHLLHDRTDTVGPETGRTTSTARHEACRSTGRDDPCARLPPVRNGQRGEYAKSRDAGGNRGGDSDPSYVHRHISRLKRHLQAVIFTRLLGRTAPPRCGPPDTRLFLPAARIRQNRNPAVDCRTVRAD